MGSLNRDMKGPNLGQVKAGSPGVGVAQPFDLAQKNLMLRRNKCGAPAQRCAHFQGWV